MEADVTGIVSGTTKHIQRITIGFLRWVADELRLDSTSGIYSTMLSLSWPNGLKTLNNGQMLQLELCVCESPSVELFEIHGDRRVESPQIAVRLDRFYSSFSPPFPGPAEAPSQG